MSGERPRNRQESRRARIGFISGAVAGTIVAAIVTIATHGFGAPFGVWLGAETAGLLGGGVFGAAIGSESTPSGNPTPIRRGRQTTE